MQSLEHIAAYLPYKLQLLWTGSHESNKDETLVSTLTIEKVREVITGHNKHATVKPILKPMSNLSNKELQIAMWDKGHSSHIDWTTTEREGWISKYGYDYWIKDIPYVIMTYLFENHYDIFGLIEKGLAVDINSIKIK